MSLVYVSPEILVRPFELDDVARVLELMRELAVFERYIDNFRVEESDIVENGLCDFPCFGVFVAEVDGDVAGIAVYYMAPWPYDLKPVLVLKELFVSKRVRGLGVGFKLFKKIKRHALEVDASRIVWTVLEDNISAYSKLIA